MAEVARDANVVVGFLDASDTLHERTTALLRRIETRGDDVTLKTSDISAPPHRATPGLHPQARQARQAPHKPPRDSTG